jgi:hypothetical protein
LSTPCHSPRYYCYLREIGRIDLWSINQLSTNQAV